MAQWPACSLLGRSVLRFPGAPAGADAITLRSPFMGAKSELAFPREQVHIGFPQEGGEYDVVRTRFRIGPWVAETARTRWVAALRVMGSDLDAESIEVVQHVVQRIFDPAQHIIPKCVGREGPVSFGVQDVEASGLAGDWGAELGRYPHWRNELKWVHGPSFVGFVSIIAGGAPTSPLQVNAAPAANRHWFYEWFPERFSPPSQDDLQVH